MKAIDWARSVKNALVRGIFPHEMSFFLDLPWRNIMLSPENLISRLALISSSQVLEVGAGSGYYSLEVARRVSEGQFVLLDLQAEMLKKAQKKIEDDRLTNVGYTLADASILPFREHSFDVIFLITVLGEIANQKDFLTEAFRVLKPRGVLSISEHLPDPDFLPFTKVKSLVQKEGFELFKQYGAKWSYTANFRKLKMT